MLNSHLHKAVLNFALVFMLSLNSLYIFSQNENPELKFLQNDYLFHIGASLYFNFNFHSTNIKEIPNVPNCCSQFSTGFGTGFGFGLEIGEPVNDKLTLSGRISYSDLYGELNEFENRSIIIDKGPVEAVIEHIIEAKYAAIAIEPLFRYRLAPRLNAIIGLSTAYLFKHNYYQQEKLLEPANRGTFENIKKVRNELSGEINDENILIVSIIGGLSFDLVPFKDNLLLSPEILIEQNLNSLLQKHNWYIFNLRLGISARFIIPDEPPPLPIEM